MDDGWVKLKLGESDKYRKDRNGCGEGDEIGEGGGEWMVWSVFGNLTNDEFILCEPISGRQVSILEMSK